MENNGKKRIFANKVDYATYLVSIAEVRRQVGNKLQVPAVAVMNYMLFKKGYGNSEEAIKRNRVYPNSIEIFLGEMPPEIVAATTKKLISVGEIVRSDKGYLELAVHVCKYFYELTEIETLDTSDTNKRVETAETDDRWSTLPSLTFFRRDELINIFEEGSFNTEDFNREGGRGLILHHFALKFLGGKYAEADESKYLNDLEILFEHFGQAKAAVRSDYLAEKNMIIRIRKKVEDRKLNGGGK